MTCKDQQREVIIAGRYSKEVITRIVLHGLVPRVALALFDARLDRLARASIGNRFTTAVLRVHDNVEGYDRICVGRWRVEVIVR